MEYTDIPGIDTPASRIGLGTWAIGGSMWGGTETDESLRTIRAALAEGVTLIDTAPAYGRGVSEEIVGRAVEESGRREDLIIATKAGIEWDGESVFRNAGRDEILREVDESLGRLRTDRIDLYQVHWPDPEVTVEETAEAMAELLEEGTIRAIGVSNFSVEQMERFRRVAPLHACQPPYNLFERDAEEEVLPYCEREGIATLTYGALCRGLLTGKMEPDTAFEGDDLRNEDPKFREPRYGQYLAAVDDLDSLARERHDRSVLELAVRWVLDRSPVTVALWGARHPAQVEPMDRVFGWSLDDDALDEIERIVERHVRDPVGPGFMAPPPRSGVG